MTTALAAGLATALGAGFATGFTEGLALTAGFAFVAGFATGFAGCLAAALTKGFTTGFAEGLLFVAGLAPTTGFATGFAGGFAAARALTAGFALADGFATGLAAGLTAGLAFMFLPVLAFTSCLLTGLACAWSWVPWTPLCAFAGRSVGVSPARECTGFPMGKPISCKIETIMGLPAGYSFVSQIEVFSRPQETLTVPVDTPFTPATAPCPATGCL